MSKHIPIEKAKATVSELTIKYPNRLPIVLLRGDAKNINLKKDKFLVEKNCTIGKFLHDIRVNIDVIHHDVSLYLMTETNMLVPVSSTIEMIYKNYKHENGFLYLTYNTENVFGENRN